MRRLSGIVGALAVALLAAAPPDTNTKSDRAGSDRRADAPPPEPAPAVTPPPARADAGARTTPLPPVVGSHQIDRYDAVRQLQKAVQANPKSLADWVILGEVAHEVAMDVPDDQAGQYLKISRDAFEHAQALAPNNAGLKAAVQFARDHEANTNQFQQSRDRMTATFLDARRRDLAATGYTPYVRVYGSGQPPTAGAPASGAPGDAPPGAPGAAPGGLRDYRKAGNRNINTSRPLNTESDTPVAEAAPAVTPPRPNAPSTDAANYGTQQNYSAVAVSAPARYPGLMYQPLAMPDGPPYTYQEYTSAYFPAGLYDNPAVPPVTLQRAVPPPPVVRPNVMERQILNRAAPSRPR